MTHVPQLGAVVFDVNETLVDLSNLREVFVVLGLPEQSLEWWFAVVLRDGMALAASGDYGSFAALAGVALEEVMSASALPVSPAAVALLLQAFSDLPLHGDVAPAVKRLGALGVPVISLTNGGADVARRLIDHAGLSSHITVHSVESVQLWKPRSEAYHFVSRELGVSAQELAMVAAHPWDLHGASLAGFSTAWVNRHERRYPSVFRSPDVHATNLLDLVERLVERAM